MNAAALFVQPKNVSGRINDHPELDEIISGLQLEFEPYKYTVYRSAAKIVKLQKYLHTSRISYKLVESLIQQRGVSGWIPPFQLTLLIRDIYNVNEKLGNLKHAKDFELERAVEMLSNFLWNIFDPKRRHSICLLEVKVTFILICRLSSNCQDIIHEFFKIIHDPKTKNISKIKFENLISIFAKIFTYIGEANAYGIQNVTEIVEQSFLKCQNPMGLTKEQFENLWFSTKTRFMIFANLIVTIKRIESSEKIIHNNPCASCGLEKIVGIRFKCQKCSNLSLCMKCFTFGYTTSRHRKGHTFIEMLNEDQPSNKATGFFAKLCNVFFTKQHNDVEEAKEFCNTIESNTPNETELVTIMGNTRENIQKQSNISVPVLSNTERKNDFLKNNVEPSLTRLSTTASNASEVSARLQSIIDRILIQNFKIEQYLILVPSASPAQISEFLQGHQKFLTDIIKEMRSFKQTSNLIVNSYPTSSTPNHSGSLNNAILMDSSNISVSGNNLTHSINGADVNRSYLEANRSDYSLSDVSVWFTQRKSLSGKKPTLDVVTEIHNDESDVTKSNAIEVDLRETEMTNFRILLNKVKEIVEDSYSDNTELAAATQNLENVLDNIIQDEESQRRSLK